MDIKTDSIESLKSAAYDQLAQMEYIQRNLKILNEEIALRQVEVIKENKVEESK